MPWETFDDACPGCLPVLFDSQTKQKLPEDNPLMQALMRAWDKTPLVERQAFHRVCCLNSRDPKDIQITRQLADRFKEEYDD